MSSRLRHTFSFYHLRHEWLTDTPVAFCGCGWRSRQMREKKDYGLITAILVTGLGAIAGYKKNAHR